MEEYSLDVCGLQEIRLEGEGKETTQYIEVAYSGKKEGKQHGVGIAVRVDRAKILRTKPVSERIMISEVEIEGAKATVLVVYAPSGNNLQEYQEYNRTSRGYMSRYMKKKVRQTKEYWLSEISTAM